MTQPAPQHPSQQYQHSPYQPNPQPGQMPPYGPPPKRRNNSLVNLAVLAIIVVVVGGGIYWRVSSMQQDRAEQEAADAQARRDATDKLNEHVEKAKALRAERKLEEAVRELEAATAMTGADDAARVGAYKLLDEVGAEYGKQFEPHVADLLKQADDALAKGEADGALVALKEAATIRYAPQHDLVEKLIAQINDAQSEAKMKSFVAAMSDSEFAAFKADVTLPVRPAFERADIDAIFKATLKLNHDKAQAWWDEAQAKKPKVAETKSLGFTLKEFRARSTRLSESEPTTKTAANGTISHSWQWGKSRSITVIGPADGPSLVAAVASCGLDNDAEFAEALVYISDVVQWVTGETVTGERLANWVKRQDELTVGKFRASIGVTRAADGLVFMLTIGAK